jgi:asparagine synthase (glutamine-hydrolysing)
MCGICGIWGRPDERAVESMVKAMHHRGPDDHGVFTDSVVSLGMSRLSIIDLSQAAHQPMSNPDRTVWIVYNGETYNFQEERRLLAEKGHTFRSRSDTEVVLRLYEQYGDDFLLRLRGMFALAIYDKRRGPGRERLLLARDQLGIKPLLFARVGNSLLFASELKGLLASGLVDAEIDPVSLRMLLTYGSVYQPRTILKNVSMLLPAHRLVAEGDDYRIERYWSFGQGRRPLLEKADHSEMVDQVSAALEESVRLQMVSDVPIGAFLSGGVDSSLLVGMMTKIAGHRVKTFSVGFGAEGAELDESREAEKTAQFLGADHTRVVITGDDLKNKLDHLIYGVDQPSVDAVNSYFISLAASQNVKVAISGTGGDEVFAGYPWFIDMARFEKERLLDGRNGESLHSRSSFLSRFLLRFGRRGHQGGRDGYDQAFITRYGNNYQIFGAYGAQQLLDPALRMEAQAGQSLQLDLNQIDELPRAGAVERVSALCLRGYTNNQLLRDIDAVSMAHSLEVRVPFLDVPLIDLALSLPVHSKLGEIREAEKPVHEISYRESGCKKILIEAGHKLGILPRDIDLQKKRGFTMPFDPWIKGHLREVLDDTLSDEAVTRRGCLKVEEVRRIKKAFCEGNVHWSQPWLLMVFELWSRKFIDRSSTFVE